MATVHPNDWFLKPTRRILVWLTLWWLAAASLGLASVTDSFEHLPTWKSNPFFYFSLVVTFPSLVRAYRNYFRNKKLSAPAAD